MDQKMLANQFIVGLKSELKAKVVGQEGSLDQLLIKAKFQEAKLRELVKSRGLGFPKKLPAPGRGTVKDSAQ